MVTHKNIAISTRMKRETCQFTIRQLNGVCFLFFHFFSNRRFTNAKYAFNYLVELAVWNETLNVIESLGALE